MSASDIIINEIMNNDSIRKTEEPILVSIYDIIRVYCKTKQPKHRWYTISKNFKFDIQISQFPGQGQRETPVVNIKFAPDVLRSAMAGCKLSLEEKKEVFGDFLPVRSYTEIEIHAKLVRAFADLNYELQYPVGTYRIDLYFIDHKLAVECDENNHRGYDIERDTNRTEFINNSLGCRWIRYDPYAKNFDIFDIINRIRVAIYH
jgi:very-short-patch-repair endonuclease